MTDDIDIVAAALSGDKKAVLKEQIRLIDREIMDRLLLQLLISGSIEEDATAIRNQMLQLDPLHEGSPDDPMKRQDRLRLQKEVLVLAKELREEKVDCSRDLKDLKREERETQKELSTVEKRDKRLGEFQ